MNKRAIYISLLPSLLCLVAALCLSGCKSHQKSAAPVIERKAITEVEEKMLEEEAVLIEAKSQLEAGNEEAAEKKYRQLLQRNDNCAAAHYEMARLMSERVQTDSALYHSRRAAEAVPSNRWYQQLLAELYGYVGLYDKQAEVWERIVALQPDNIDNYYSLAGTYLHDGKPERAIDALNRVEKLIGINEATSIKKQEIYEATGDNKKAMREIELLAKAMPHETKYNAMMAESYMRQKDYGHAKPFYDNILRNNPDDEYIHISLANYYKLTGDMPTAIDELEKGLLHPMLDCESRLQILTTFFSAEDFYKTYAPRTYILADTIVSHCTDSVQYAIFYGDLLMRQEKYDEAAGWIRLYLRKDSSQYEIWESLLICESMMADADSLLQQDARKAARLFPLHTLPHYLLSIGACTRKNYEEALSYAEYCRKIGFRNHYLEAECYNIMADCYYNMGEYEKAWQYFEKVLEIKPDDLGTLNNYAYYISEHETNRDRLVKAEQMSRRTIEAEPDNATYLDTYAWILHKLGHDHDALPYMERAVQLSDGKNDTLNRHLKTIQQHQ